MVDAIPVARHRLERVVDSDVGVAEMFDLLQHRVGQSVCERIAGDQQHRQPVGVRRPCGGDHVERARPDRRCRDHDLTPPLGLSEADGGQRHRLLVLSAPGRQTVLHGFQSLAKAGHVAVPENGEHSGEQRDARAVDRGELLRQPAHRGLRHGQPDGRLRHLVSSLSD
jgi:hypothetical protein